MRPLILAAALLALAAPLAQAEAPSKKKKKNAYNATEFIQKKEAKAPLVVDTAKKDAAKGDATTGGLTKYDCQPAETSPTAQQAVAEKPTDKTKGEKPAANSTEQAIEMAKTVVRTVADNCRGKTGPSVQPDVGVSVTNPEATFTKDKKGERPELSGTVGVSATF